MLEARGKVTGGARDMAIDRVPLSAGWRRMMGLVKNQQATRTERPEPISKGRDIRFINEKALGDQESRVGCPRIHAEAAFAAHPLDVILIQDLEAQTESRV